MSFDLAAWESETPLTDDEARVVYLRLYEEWPYLEGDSPAVGAFYQELIEKWPEIDTIPEDRVGDLDFCPWSCTLNHSGMAVAISCVWSKANDVAEHVGSLAQKHRLLLFDPQADRVVLPDHLRPKKRGLWQRLFGSSR